MSRRGAIVEALAHGMTSVHQLTLGDDVYIARIRDVAVLTSTAIHADYRIHNMPTSFEASHQSSHDDTCSRHDTLVYTPSVPLNQFETLYTPSVPLNNLETPHTPSVPPNKAFEATKAFPFDRTPTSSRHFNASPIMMNLSGTLFYMCFCCCSATDVCHKSVAKQRQNTKSVYEFNHQQRV